MDVLKLAGRYVRTRRIALVCVFSVAVGVMALVVVTSLMDGVQRFYKATIKGSMADLWVAAPLLPASARNRHFAFVEKTLEPLMEENGGPIAAIAPRQIGPAIIVRGRTLESRDEDSSEGIRIFGIDWERERRIVPLERMLRAVKDVTLAVPEDRLGDPLASEDLPGVILGDDLCRRLGVARVAGPGRTDLVTIFSVDLTRDEDGRLRSPRRKAVFRVMGCFSSGREDYDGHMAYMDREVLQRLRFEEPFLHQDATRIYVRVVPGETAASVAERIRRRMPQLRCQTWEEENRNLLTALHDQKRILVFILAFIVAVACCAILGLIAMMVLEKVRDIGILRSMGMPAGRIVIMFTLYGMTLAAVGSFLGAVLGIQVTRHLDGLIGVLSDLFGVQLLDASVYHFESVPTHLDPRAVARIIFYVLLGSLVASLLPALRAAFMQPVRCLRQE